jgi:hypothetical protein
VAPDDGLAACIAKMPTAGTISDGSVNRNWTGPGELGQPGVHHPKLAPGLAPNSLGWGEMA